LSIGRATNNGVGLPLVAYKYASNLIINNKITAADAMSKGNTAPSILFL
jgi:hypothetical protein